MPADGAAKKNPSRQATSPGLENSSRIMRDDWRTKATAKTGQGGER